MSPSGLNRRHQRAARQLVKLAWARLLADPGNVHYTMGAARWDGIAHRKGIHKPGFWPFWGDCSATVTWVLWRALAVGFGVRDLVNGAHWVAGYTGTMAGHGRRIARAATLRVGDAVLYGPAPTYEHVAQVIAFRRVGLNPRVPFVGSHGSEGGPYLLPYNYRPDVGEFRRYI